MTNLEELGKTKLLNNELFGYKLSRKWFDFCFQNPEIIKPTHTALYFFCIELCNRLGWKEKFGLPTTMAMEAIGIHSYNTYINTLNDLVNFGFILLIQKSKNQYSSNIIALSNFNKALDKALDKALIKHSTKHSTKQHESTSESICSINKQVNNKQINNKQEREEHAQENSENVVSITSQEIELGEQKKVAPKKESENSIVIYPIEEIEQRFKNWEYEIWEGIMRNYQLTKQEYEKGVDLFLFEQGQDNLKRDYGDIKKHFKAWVRINIKHIKQKDNVKDTILQRIEASEKAKPIIEAYFENKKHSQQQ